MATFADLGIPFPLFEAPTSAASGYEGPATCRLCQVGGRHCFRVSDLIEPCPACGVANALSAHTRAEAACRSCRSPIPFPEHLRAKKQMLACYDCLRAGRAAIGKSTEYGMVGPDQAFIGVTHGVPGLETDQFELVRIGPPDEGEDEDQEWRGARIPSEHLWELLRTPDIGNWQDETWLFCCRRPMTYVGNWNDVLASARPDDPLAFFDALFEPDSGWKPERDPEDDPRVLIDAEGSSYSLYVYRCPACGRHRATTDSD